MCQFSCRYDYLKITDDRSRQVGKYCGELPGKKVFVDGNYVVLTFHSDHVTEQKGFRIFFTFTQFSKCNETVFIIE